MKKTIFEEMGDTYVRQEDYLIPCLALLAEKENQPIGIWGQCHKHYLKQNHKVVYMNLLTSGKLNGYLADINEQAEKVFSRLVKQFADMQGVTENMKVENLCEWIRRMNNIQACVREVVNAELIYIEMILLLFEI